MKKNFFLKILIICLLVSGLAVPAFAAKKAPPKKAPPKKGGAPAPVEKEEDIGKPELRYTGFEAKRDPFLPPEKLVKLVERAKTPIVQEKPKQLPKIDMQGLIWSPKMPQVIINEKVLGVGDFIGEWEIKEIDRDGIILFFKGQQYKLRPQQ